MERKAKPVSAHRPPSPIPTATGSRSAALPLFSHHLDRSIRIPQLTLPPRNLNKPNDLHHPFSVRIHYPSIAVRDKDTIARLLGSLRSGGFGAFQITAHGISTHDLRLASFFHHCERIFGSLQRCCTSYGDHDEFLYDPEEAMSVIGRQNFQIFREKLDSVARQLEGIAQELGKAIIVESGLKHHEGKGRLPFELGEAALCICRYHPTTSTTRVNPPPRNYSCGSQESTTSDSPYALSLHLLLDSSEFCIEHEDGYSLAFTASPDTLVVATGKEIEEWSDGELKSGQGKTMLKRALVQADCRNDKPSYSIQQKWTWQGTSNIRKIGGKSRSRIFSITLIDQVSILLVASLVYKLVAHGVYSST